MSLPMRVGAEEELRARGEQALGWMQGPHVLGVGSEPGSEDRAEDEPRDEHEAERGGAILAEPAKEDPHFAHLLGFPARRTAARGCAHLAHSLGSMKRWTTSTQ